MMKSFLVSYNLDRNRFSSAMVPAIENLTKGSLPEGINDLVTICQMVMVDHEIIATLIVISVVVVGVLQNCQFLLAVSTDAIDRRIIQNFLPLKFG